MLRLSKKTDYALLALSCLTCAGEEDRAVSAREIAERYGIPVAFLAKILQALVRGKVLVSTSGQAGGYRLARPAGQISVGAVIAIVDGPTALAECRCGNDCDGEDGCASRDPLNTINARISEMLNTISVAEIAE